MGSYPEAVGCTNTDTNTHETLPTTSAVHWYTQINNERVEPHEQDAAKYEYALTAYDQNGNTHEVQFKTSRMLKDKAYLQLETMPIRGVISWEEVQWNDIPKSARSSFEEPQ